MLSEINSAFQYFFKPYSSNGWIKNILFITFVGTFCAYGVLYLAVKGIFELLNLCFSENGQFWPEVCGFVLF